MAMAEQIHTSTTDRATQYAIDVVESRLVAGPHVRDACRRHLTDIEYGHERGLVWDVAAANRIINFFPDVLRLSEGQFEGIPFNLHDSQAFIAGSLFGWKRADGTRRFRRGYIEQGKGNGKSPFLGGIGLYGLIADREAGAQIYSAAAKKEQAKILFDDAVKMYQQSPDLLRRLHSSGGSSIWNLAHLKSGSFFRPISRDAGKSGSGPRPHFALCDEVHEHPDRKTMEMLERGFKFRRQPLLLMITNSGSDRNSICWEEHEHAVRVASGEVEDDTTFSYVCALDEDDDPLEDPSCWVKANPLLGTILTHDYLAGVVSQAKAIPGQLNGILRLHFCVWTDAERAWVARATWEACEDPELRLEDFVGKPCRMGLDLSATTDLCGKAYVFDDGVDAEGRPKYALFARGFTPADTISARELKDKTPYTAWRDAGFLIAPPGKKIRLDYVAYSIKEDQDKFDLKQVAYDAFLIKDFASECDAIGAELPLIEHPQGFNSRQNTHLWMPGSIGYFETLLLEKRIRIEVNPALRTAVASSAMLPSPAGLRRFDKIKSNRRIDLAVASAMAIGSAMTPSEQEEEYSVSGTLTVAA